MTRLETLRKRALQRFTSPPDVLYALSRHWMVIIGFAAFGTLVMAAKVSTDTPVYEAKATMSLTTDQSIVVQENSKGGREDERLRISRVALFTSDTVLRRLVQSLKAPNLLAQDENPEEPSYGPVRRFISRVKRKIDEFRTYLEHPQIQDYGEEREIQRAVTAFRRRSEVVPNPKTSAVQIYVYGTNRELLLKELEQWIAVYKQRLVELSGEPRHFLDSMRQRWRAMEENARDDLETYRRENPDLSKEARDLLFEQIVRLQTRREEIERWMDGGGVFLAPREITEPPNPEVEALLSQKRELEAERRKNQPFFPPESDKQRALSESIRLVDEKLREVLGLGSNGAPVDRPNLKEQVDALTEQINSATEEQSALAPRLDILRNKEEEHRHAQRTRMDYEVKSHEELDRRESTKFIAAQVIEEPQASWLPYETYPYRQILYGCLGGFFAACTLALLIELFRTSVRFKSDIETEFPVRVVGVIPLR